MLHKAAITGIGIVSSIGNNIYEAADSLYSGKTGIVFDGERKRLGFLSALTGEVRNFDACLYVNRKQQKTMTDFTVWAYAAAKQALEQSGLDTKDIASNDTGLIFGCDSSCMASIEQYGKLLETGSTSRIGSGQVFKMMTSNITMNLNTILKTKGACYTISSACSSGGHAIGLAADMIAMGRQERIICGGAQEINWQALCSFDGLGAFADDSINPAEASKPFDKSRTGLIPSGGAAAIVLENFDSAKKRGADIIGTVCGYGFSSDGENLTIPSDTGLYSAMKRAVAASGKKLEEIDYICAHATSTIIGDKKEAANIAKLFEGLTIPPVASLKAITGHELWAAGASQAVYCAIMAEKGFTAPNYNYSEPDDEFMYLPVLKERLERPPKCVLCNSAGFGGTNASIIIDFSNE